LIESFFGDVDPYVSNVRYDQYITMTANDKMESPLVMTESNELALERGPSVESPHAVDALATYLIAVEIAPAGDIPELNSNRLFASAGESCWATCRMSLQSDISSRIFDYPPRFVLRYARWTS